MDDVTAITRSDSAYPPLLKEMNDPPEQIYIRGDASILSAPHILASVGSRKANSYGKQAISILLPPAVRADIVITSGLAYGVDALSHQVAVKEKKPTIAVLGGGIDDKTIYPAPHRKLAHEILEYGGAIVSEWPPGTPARPAHFLQRNRIIAGLAQATLVVQAATKSGSLVTARLALDYNREVLAVPGNINEPIAQGTNLLIQEGAIPALSPQDIAAVFKIDFSKAGSKIKNLNKEQKTILKHVSADPRHVDEISGLVQLPANQVSTLLLELELEDRVMHVGGMKYIKK